MDTLLQLIDRWTEKIPSGGLKFIRFSALFLWLSCALAVAFYAFVKGTQSAPQTGQDLSRATIQERITKEANLKNPPAMNTDLKEFLTEQELEETPFTQHRNDTGLAGPLPPFIGESGTNDPYVPYLPEQRTEKEDSLQVFPLSNKKKTADTPTTPSLPTLQLLPITETDRQSTKEQTNP